MKEKRLVNSKKEECLLKYIVEEITTSLIALRTLDESEQLLRRFCSEKFRWSIVDVGKPWEGTLLISKHCSVDRMFYYSEN